MKVIATAKIIAARTRFLEPAPLSSLTAMMRRQDTPVALGASAADQGALTCFDAAARACKPASLHVTDFGVDTGTDYVFTIESGGPSCRVTERSNFYSANGGGSTGPVTTTTCLRVAVTGEGVSLSCAGQDVLITAHVHAGLS